MQQSAYSRLKNARHIQQGKGQKRIRPHERKTYWCDKIIMKIGSVLNRNDSYFINKLKSK